MRRPARASVLLLVAIACLSVPQHASAADGVDLSCTDFRTGTTTHVYAQRLQPDGTVLPDWTLTNPALCVATDRQFAFSTADDGSGGAVVVWVEDSPSGADLFAERLTSTGAAVAGWPAGGLAVCEAPRDQYAPRVVGDGAGGAYVCWQDYRDGTAALYAQHLTASGALASGWPAGGAMLRGGAGVDPLAPAIAADGVGGAIVVWQETRAQRSTVCVVRLSAAGGVAAGWNPAGTIAASSTHAQGSPVVVADGSGGAIVVWEESTDAGGTHLRGQHLDGAGSPAAGSPVTGFTVCTAAGEQRFASLVADGAGGAIVAWYDRRSGGGDVYAQRVGPSGAVSAGWPEQGLAVCAAGGEQYGPSAVTDGAGGAVIAWEDYRQDGAGDVRAARVAADGTKPANWGTDGLAVCDVAGAQSAPLAQSVAGGTLLSWLDDRAVGSAHLFRAQRARTATPALVKVEVADRVTKLVWRLPGAGVAALERAPEQGDWSEVARLSSDASGIVTFADRAPEEAVRVRYRVLSTVGDNSARSEEVQVNVPLSFALALHGARPSPSRDILRVSFSLPGSAPARLELLDIAGRRIEARDVGSLGAGHHLVEFGRTVRVPSGVYLLRLSQGGRSLTTIATVLR